MGRVEGKIAIVTGGASGIGKASAIMLAREGAVVVVSDVKESDRQNLEAEIGNGSLFVRHDVTNPTQWQEIIALTRERFGQLDILVNCAGITGLKTPQNLEEVTLESWHQIMNVNVEGILLGCQNAIPLMKETAGGSIINLSSIAATVAMPSAVAYGASKAAIAQLTKSVALYCAKADYNIRCNAILPGAVLTPIWDDLLGEGEQREENSQKIIADIPLGRWGQPDDIAYAVIYLASDESKFTTGAQFIIDGGESIVL